MFQNTPQLKSSSKEPFYKLMLITQKENQPLRSYLKFIKQCLKGGITSLQLREKTLKFNELISFGSELKHLLNPSKIPLIINDSLKIAVELNADGLHLGQKDGDVLKARKNLGSHKIIGLTVNSREELLKANHLPINYVGIGAIFPTQNKLNVQTVWGCKGLNEMTRLSRHKMIAIGGIDLRNAKKVISAGADGIAAIGLFHNAKKPFEATKKLKEIMNTHSEG